MRNILEIKLKQLHRQHSPLNPNFTL